MSKPIKQPKIRVALKLPGKVAELIFRGQYVHDQMAANSKTLPAPSPALPILQTQVTDLQTKEQLTKTRAPGSTGDRDAARTLLEQSLRSERAYVEQRCNADPTNAATIAQDAGMTLVKPGSFAKPPLAIKHPASGKVQLVAQATKGAKANVWQYSTDGGKTWSDLPPTSRARTTVENLTPGITVTVRHRPMTKAGLGDWTQPVSAVVS